MYTLLSSGCSFPQRWKPVLWVCVSDSRCYIHVMIYADTSTLAQKMVWRYHVVSMHDLALLPSPCALLLGPHHHGFQYSVMGAFIDFELEEVISMLLHLFRRNTRRVFGSCRDFFGSCKAVWMCSADAKNSRNSCLAG